MPPEYTDRLKGAMFAREMMSGQANDIASAQFENRLIRGDHQVAFGPGIGAPAQIPQVLPVEPVQPAANGQQAADQSNEPKQGIFPVTVPWLFSVGKQPYKVKVGRWYTFMVKLPSRTIIIPQDFVLEEIVAYYTLNNRMAADFGNPETYEVNLVFNRAKMFTNPVPIQFFPKAPYSLQLPCPYYLPKGTQMVIEGLDQTAWLWDDSMGQMVYLGLAGHFAVDQVPEEIVYSLARPMFYVARFDLFSSGAQEAQQQSLTTTRDCKAFEMNRLISGALWGHENQNLAPFTPLVDWIPTAPPNVEPFLYPNPPGVGNFPFMEHSGLVRLTISNIFQTSPFLAPWQMVWGINNFPRHVTPPVKVCSGSPFLIEYSDTFVPRTQQSSYYVIGGKNLFD